jgi:phosphoserine phosphatase RsbU/P
VILLDMNYARDTTSGSEGLDLLARLRRWNRDTPVLVMTAWGNIDLAVEAMKIGAADFIQKPWDNHRLLGTMERFARGAAQASAGREAARRIYRRLLAQPPKPLHTVEFDAASEPFSDIGGDYYDFFDLGPGRAGFVLADASGKGVGGALLMANLRATFRVVSSEITDAAGLLESVNRQFYESTPAEQYATLFFGEYDDRTRRLRYVNCAHPAPLLRRADGGIERLESTGTALGLFPEWRGAAAEATLEAGDVLLVYSDGVTDAGPEEEPLGEKCLAKLLRESVSSAGILNEVRSAGLTDDATVLLIRLVTRHESRLPAAGASS